MYPYPTCISSGCRRVAAAEQRSYVHMVTERSRMSNMQTQHCPVPVHSMAIILTGTSITFWDLDLCIHIVAKCYNVFLMHNTKCIRYDYSGGAWKLLTADIPR